MKIQICTQALKKYLLTKKISQNQLAKKIGISREHLNRIVHGKYKKPSNRVIAGLLHWTKIPFEELFILDPNPEPNMVSEEQQLYSKDLLSDHS